jgi:diguanylate cyclase (GGDEF)-like protein/putative nucleotidyltransferase with HDIG domain
MEPPGLKDAPPPGGDPCAQELASLRERLEQSEQHTAVVLMRATRLAQVISVLGSQRDLETTVERIAMELGELFFADMTLLILESDAGLTVPGFWGVAAADLPPEPFTLPAVQAALSHGSVCIGPVGDVPLPDWLAPYAPRQLAWARLMVGDVSLGLLLLARRGEEAFEPSDATELRAVAYRIALAVENGVLHEQMKDQLAQLHRLQQLTSVLAGTLELDAVGQLVADMLVSEAAVSSSVVLIERGGELSVLSTAGRAQDLHVSDERSGDVVLDAAWEIVPLKVADKKVGAVAVAGAPEAGSERYELLLHLVSLGALSLDKALLYEQSREQARHDSLTGLLGHGVCHEELEQLIAGGNPFSVLLFDIDDFKQINDLHGHQTGDGALRLVADALRQGTRTGDTVFRVGGEEFCALLPDLPERAAFASAEAIRQRVDAILVNLPNPVTVSVGVASFPAHGRTRDELLAAADAALYASKRAGKNRTSIAGEPDPAHPAHPGDPAPSRREVGLDLLHRKDPDTVTHSVHVAILAVKIARVLAVDDARLDDLRIAARLHDIGKLGVPDAILNKPGPLDDEEFRIVKTHPVVGAELLGNWGLDAPAAIALQHHERVDGGGYPAGLRGDEIRIESRIIHAADAYVAMTRDRPYREAMTRAEAFAELTSHSGTQFDPAVVAALIALESPRPAPSAAAAAVTPVLREPPLASDVTFAV